MDAPSIRKSVMVTGVKIGLVHLIILLLGTFPVITAETQDVAAEAPLFSCKGRSSGYYADVQSGCQKYYMCDASGRLYSYTCPNRTLFQQRVMICDHWFMVDCSLSENYFSSNLRIGAKGKPFLEGNEEAYRLTPEKASFNRQPKTTTYQRSEATTPYRRHDETNISPYRRYLAGLTTTRRYEQSTTPSTRRYEPSSTTTRRYEASTTPSRRYEASTTPSRRYEASTTLSRRYEASTTPSRRYETSSTTTRRYELSSTTTRRYEASTTPYPWQSSPKSTESDFIKELKVNKSQFSNAVPSSQVLAKNRDDGKYRPTELSDEDKTKYIDDGKYRPTSDKKDNDVFSNTSVKTVGGGTLPKAFANNPFFNAFTTSTSEAPLLITNKGQSYLLTSPIPFRKDHGNVFDKNQPAFNNTVKSTLTTTSLRTTSATPPPPPLSNKYHNLAYTFSTPRRDELRNTLPNNQFTRTTEAPLNSEHHFVAPQGQVSQFRKDSPELRNIFTNKFTNSDVSSPPSKSPLTTQYEFFSKTKVERLQDDTTIVHESRVEDLGVDISHDHEEDLLTNTVEVRIPDTRHMFYIPDNPTRVAEMLSINNETVLTISLPSLSSSKHHGAMKFKGSRSSKGVREDCPLCHPAFLLPGKCQPCVLIR